MAPRQASSASGPVTASVVITAFDVSTYLDEAISSALASDGVAEVVVVADASPPDAEVARSAAALDARVVVVERCSWLVRADALRRVGGFDGRFRSNEDVELMTRLLAAVVVREIDDVVLAKRMHATQQTQDTLLQRRTHLEACWWALRRSASADRSDVLRGIRSCYVARATRNLDHGYRSRRALRALAWWIVAQGWLVAGAVERVLRAVKGRQAPPRLMACDHTR